MLEIGTKVVPHNKTYGNSLEKSVAWKKAREKGQPYLYVTRNEADHWGDSKYALSVDKDGGGDFFNREDFTLYKEEHDQTREDLLDLLDEKNERLIQLEETIEKMRELLR